MNGGYEKLEKKQRKNAEILFSDFPKESYSTDQRLLFDLRRYLKVIVALQAVFVLTIVVAIVAIWVQLSRYDVFKKQQMNTLSADIHTIMANAATMSALAVPIVGNTQFVTNAVVTAVSTGMNATTVNSTASEARANAGAAVSRHLLQQYVETEVPSEGVVTSNDMAIEDMRLRQMLRSQMSTLLNTTNAQMAKFNPASVSDLLHWVVHGVNYTSLQTDFDRVMTDIERTSHFAVLATSMLGLAASATNTTMPSPSELFASYSQQKQLASASASPSACNGRK
jgi:hypothetical protein